MFIKLTRVLPSGLDVNETVYLNVNHIISFSPCLGLEGNDIVTRVVLKLKFCKIRKGHNELSLVVKESCEDIIKIIGGGNV